MDLETRVKNLEDMLASIANTITNNKSYTDADIDGVRHSVSEITPYQETKTAYIEDTEVVFENVPSGAVTIAFNNPGIGYMVRYEDNSIVVDFSAPLEEVTEVTLTII